MKINVLVYLTKFHFVTNLVRPLSMVDDEYFKKMLKKFDSRFNMPTRKTIKSRLLHIRRAVNSMVAMDMEKYWNVVPALTTDHWTSNNNEGYFSLTMHYINEKWVLKSKSLGVTPFPRPHTAVRVAEATK